MQKNCCKSMAAYIADASRLQSGPAFKERTTAGVIRQSWHIMAKIP